MDKFYQIVQRTLILDLFLDPVLYSLDVMVRDSFYVFNLLIKGRFRVQCSLIYLLKSLNCLFQRLFFFEFDNAVFNQKLKPADLNFDSVPIEGGF